MSVNVGMHFRKTPVHGRGFFVLDTLLQKSMMEEYHFSKLMKRTTTKYQAFDWEKAEERAINKRKFAWLLEFCDKRVKERRFILENTVLRAFDSRTGVGRRYTERYLHKEYLRLKHRFGFFRGEKLQEKTPDNEEGKDVSS